MPYIPLKEKPYANVDSIGNSVAIEEFYDADKDDFFNNKRRKGLTEFADLGTSKPIDGLFEPIDQNIAAAFSGGRLFKVEQDKTVTEITGVTLNSNTPVKFADFGSEGYFCNNSRILRWVYADAACAFIADGDAPTNATFLGFLDSYLIALRKDTQRFDWSNVGAPTVWSGEFASAESRPDKLVALDAAFGELFLAGSRTIEHWVDSGVASTPFQRLAGTLTERGSISPYSLAQLDNSYMFLDEERRVIRMRGREPQVISNPFDSEFQAITDITDAIGMHFNAAGDTKYVITFPTENKTYAYDYKLDFWSRWSYWDTDMAQRRKWIGNCGQMFSNWNKYLVGSNADGKIYEAGNFFDDDSDTVNTEIITGRINWGNDRRKSCKRIRIHVKRGVGDQDTEATLIVNYRDNGKTQWSHDFEFNLGLAGDNEAYITKRNLGTYRNRQWRFRISSGELLLVSVEEDFTVI